VRRAILYQRPQCPRLPGGRSDGLAAPRGTVTPSAPSSLSRACRFSSSVVLMTGGNPSALKRKQGYGQFSPCPVDIGLVTFTRVVIDDQLGVAQARHVALVFFAGTPRLQKVHLPIRLTPAAASAYRKAEKQGSAGQPRLERRRATVRCPRKRSPKAALPKRTVAARPLEPWEPWFYVEDDLVLRLFPGAVARTATRCDKLACRMCCRRSGCVGGRAVHGHQRFSKRSRPSARADPATSSRPEV
jgi:hypothetical protein